MSDCANLEGKWIIDPSDSGGLAAFGNVAMEFHSGRLWYEIREREGGKVILMTYQIDGDTLIVDQPSHPHPQRTKYEINGNSLKLTFEGVPCRFIRT
jgi:hypothetical protein